MRFHRYAGDMICVHECEVVGIGNITKFWALHLKRFRVAWKELLIVDNKLKCYYYDCNCCSNKVFDPLSDPTWLNGKGAADSIFAGFGRSWENRAIIVKGVLLC